MSLKRARRTLNWTQPRLATEAGEKISAIFDIEAKRSKDPAYTRVVRIFRALRCGGLNPDISIDDIFPVPDPPACLKGPDGTPTGRKKAA